MQSRLAGMRLVADQPEQLVFVHARTRWKARARRGRCPSAFWC
jgi:hypothetical protein